MTSIANGKDGKPRCSWCASAPEFLDYHDREWGFPVDDDFRLFEKICLEGFQSGLSWRTVLSKRENFRAAFHSFDFNKIAKYSDNDIARLLKDTGIIRHKGKIEAVINNAKCAQKLVRTEGSLAAYFWRFEPTKDEVSPPQTASTSNGSVALAKALKKQGWKFVGPTTVYAFMQAMGLINDHVEGCIVREEVEKARSVFIRPKNIQ